MALALAVVAAVAVAVVVAVKMADVLVSGLPLVAEVLIGVIF